MAFCSATRAASSQNLLVDPRPLVCLSPPQCFGAALLVRWSFELLGLPNGLAQPVTPTGGVPTGSLPAVVHEPTRVSLDEADFATFVLQRPLFRAAAEAHPWLSQMLLPQPRS